MDGVPHQSSFEELPAYCSSWIHCLAGSVAGLAEHGLMYPLDFAKTRMMSFRVTSNSISENISQAIHREGVLRPLRGISVVAISAGPAHGLYFASYELSKRAFSNNHNPSGQNFIANGMAGVVATLMHDCVMVPADTLKQQLQRYNSPYKSPISCVQGILLQEGLSGLYRSYWAQDVLTGSKGTNEDQMTVLAHILSGGGAGALAAACTTPFDVCKTFINTREPVGTERRTASTLRQALLLIWQHRGYRGFLTGMRARVLYTAPSTAIAWAVYESFKTWLAET